MFDGTLKATRDEGADLARLRTVYDGLLAEPSTPPDAAALAELTAMAHIFDLDAARPPAQVWRDLRAVLMRQAEPDGRGDDMLPAVRPLTLLVVEDDPDMAAALTELLTDAGHGVVGPFSDAATATTAASLHAVDLALLDINLAGDGEGEGGGVALARTLKQSWGVPAIFLSADVTAAARHARLATALVLKPYRRADVLNGIARAVAAGAVPA
ncbi:MAG: response regulator [Brevundimonas sp.]